MDDWCVIDQLSDLPSAEALAQMLEQAGVRTLVWAASGYGLLQRSYEVLVVSTLVHRARWLLALSDVTDVELDFLATGEFPRRS